MGLWAEGNLLSDGVRNYTWDAENRLIAQEMSTSLPAGARQRLEFTYDWQGRRIRKLVKNSSLQVISDTRFVYDGWNLVAELNSDLSLKTSYTWGLDLSGSSQGAGGVGGLLFAVYYSPSTEVYFPAYDGNGNVMALCKGSDATWAAQYEYGPFGELLRATGPMAKANPFRFSTKYQDEETGLVYYGYRYYCASLGRWLNRDPIEEEGGKNLYEFGVNDTVNDSDMLGWTIDWVAQNTWAENEEWGNSTIYGSFLEGECKLKLKVKIHFSGKTKALNEATPHKQAWQSAFHTTFSGWKIVSKEQCCQCAEGIKLDFSWEEDQGHGYEVEIVRGYGRSNSAKWFLWGQRSGSDTITKAPYRTSVHEVAHLFGLADEYMDPKYPDRVVPKDSATSIMGSGSEANARHIKTIMWNADAEKHLPCGPYDLTK